MEAPDKIYLQIDGDSFGEWEGATWCQDKINDTDVEYVRAVMDEKCPNCATGYLKKNVHICKCGYEEVTKD